MDPLSTNQSGKLTKSRREFIEKSGLTAALTMFGIGFLHPAQILMIWSPLEAPVHP
ncbi:hypothetical protein V8V91_02365 [Algoriphagus halophilus]|uniref:hypothetical protein n=1 Tax=Algoriphagus halophilus TaxID=226505 RepID=UPI00358F8A92